MNDPVTDICGVVTFELPKGSLSYDAHIPGVHFGNLPRACGSEAISYRGCSAVRVPTQNHFESNWDFIFPGNTVERIHLCDRPIGLVDMFRILVDREFSKLEKVKDPADQVKPFCGKRANQRSENQIERPIPLEKSVCANLRPSETVYSGTDQAKPISLKPDTRVGDSGEGNVPPSLARGGNENLRAEPALTKKQNQ